MMMMMILRLRWCVLKQCWRVFNLVANQPTRPTKQPSNQPTNQPTRPSHKKPTIWSEASPAPLFSPRVKNCTITKMCSVQCCSSVQIKRRVIETSKKVQSAKTEKSKKGLEMKLLSDLATHFTVLTLAFTIISRKILVKDFSRKKKKMTR